VATVECSTLDGINNVKAILALQRKVLPMQIYLDTSFFNYEAGQVWTPQDSYIVGDHATCIVGYDEAKQAFKVRNSWGPYWGEEGYVWIGYEAFELPFTGALAITLSDEYDPAVAMRFGLKTGGWTPVLGVEASDGTTAGGVQVSWDKHFSADGYKVYRDSTASPVQTIAGGNTTS
jgi:Papain family cysteine protease